MIPDPKSEPSGSTVSPAPKEGGGRLDAAAQGDTQRISSAGATDGSTVPDVSTAPGKSAVPDVSTVPSADAGAELQAILGDQPVHVVDAYGASITLLGTAHVSRSSAETVRALVHSGHFDAVAIELDAGRHAALSNADQYAKMDLFKVFREGKAGMVAANLALSAFQQRLADQLGVEPGAEMKAAIEATREAQLPLLLVDRDIGVTLRRVYANVSFWQRLTILSGLIASVMSREKISEEEIEHLKEGDMLETTFTEFAERSERLYVPLITERDAYIAARLEQEAKRLPRPADDRPLAILAVLGAGHLKGVRGLLEAPPAAEAAQRIRDLAVVPKQRRWGRIVPWIIVGIVAVGFVLGFLRSPSLGLTLLLEWVLFHGVLAGLGALVALAHPLTVVATALASPLTALNPLIGVGIVAAGVETWIRKPSVGDFANLRRDVTSLRGWWRNRVARIFLVFLFSTLGSSIGTYVAGFRIIGQLFR